MRIFLAVMLFMVLGIGCVSAELTLPEQEIEIGAEVSHIKYEEPDVMNEKGMMYGISGDFTYHKDYMVGAETKLSYGQVDYENSGTMDDIDDVMFEIRGIGGYDIPIFSSSVITPYIGLGYRYLYDDLRGTTSTGASGYRRESNYYYSPIGIETLTDLGNKWFLGLRIEYDYFWKGVQKSYLSDYSSTAKDIENDQDKGYGVRASIKLKKNSERVDWSIEPFVKYWDIEDSDLAYSGIINGLISYGYEPKNNSTEIGVKIGAQF